MESNIQNPPQTSPLDILPQPAPPHYAPKAAVILWLIVFPPLAWYKIWENKLLHSWFPILLWLYGTGILLSYTLQLFVISKMSALYSEINIPLTTQTFTQILPAALIIFAIVQIVFGFYLKSKIKSSAAPPAKLMWTAILIFAVDYIIPLIGSAGVLSSILPIYNLTTAI